jgi:hypothetical protein
VFTDPLGDPLLIKNESGLMDCLRNNTLFDPQKLRNVMFLSEPVRYNTPGETSQPENLHWFRVDRQTSLGDLQLKRIQEVESRFYVDFVAPSAHRQIATTGSHVLVIATTGQTGFPLRTVGIIQQQERGARS